MTRSSSTNKQLYSNYTFSVGIYFGKTAYLKNKSHIQARLKANGARIYFVFKYYKPFRL